MNKRTVSTAEAAAICGLPNSRALLWRLSEEPLPGRVTPEVARLTAKSWDRPALEFLVATCWSSDARAERNRQLVARSIAEFDSQP